jgi:hypothetical protein
MAVIILSRSSQNYPNVPPTSQESRTLGYLLQYPSHHVGFLPKISNRVDFKCLYHKFVNLIFPFTMFTTPFFMEYVDLIYLVDLKFMINKNLKYNSQTTKFFCNDYK